VSVEFDVDGVDEEEDICTTSRKYVINSPKSCANTTTARLVTR